MRNILSRVLLFFLAIPAIVASIWFDPTEHGLIMNFVVLAVALGSVIEVLGLFEIQRKISLQYFLGIVSGVLPSVAAFLVLVLNAPIHLLYFSIFGLIILVAAILVFTYKPGSGSFVRWMLPPFLAIYPGGFVAHFFLISGLENHKLLVLLFLLMVFLNDSMAYVGGMLFGRFSTHPFSLSPKKTTVGLIFGLSFSVLVALAGYQAFPELFSNGGLASALGLGLLVGILSVAGDLLESGLKRHAGVKDSGSVIPGRGGLMDSIDSALFAVPVFYAGFALLQA